jgi:hypothetical protein
VIRKLQLNAALLYRGDPKNAAIAAAENIQFFAAIAVRHECSFLQQNIYS